MTPPLQWVFLLALVGSAASLPRFLSKDACAILCHPVTRSSPEGVCELRRTQSGSVLDQARTIASHCLKLCDHELTFFTGVNCQILTTLLANYRGCYCPSTKAMPDNERILPIVNELAEDIVSPISSSFLGKQTVCGLYTALSLENTGVERTSLDVNCHPLRVTQDLTNVDMEERFQQRALMDLKVRDMKVLNNEKSTRAPSDSSEDGEVDWEKWCMSQCNNGHGGNACRCDLIP